MTGKQLLRTGTSMGDLRIHPNRSAYVLALVFVALATGIVTTGYLYYRNYEKHYRAEVERRISAVADLKVGEIVQWRRQRLGDARVFHRNENFSGLVRRYLEGPQDTDAGRRLRTWLGKVRDAYQYDRIFLLDIQGVERVAVPDTPEPTAPHLLEGSSKILRSGQIVFLDFHRDAPHRPIHLSILVPIVDERDSDRPLGFLVLRIDPAAYLYPFIQRWPTPSRTAETLLVRREGDDVLFLNELRFQKNTALNLLSSIDLVQLPAARAALGYAGIMEGFDYRGVPMIACVRSVPDSPWFLLAKIDTEEVYAPLRKKLWEVVALIGVLLLAAGAGVGMVWRQQRARFYRERYEAAERLRRISSRQEAILSAVPDIIMEVDRHKVYTWANQPGIEFFGGDVIGKEAAFYFEGEQETYDVVQPLFNGNESVIYVESWQRRVDGEKRLLAWWCRVLKDRDGQVTGALSSARDITERKRSEEEREKLIQELQGALAKVKLLSGMLPICSSCKKIRDDKGYWTHIESYVRRHSEADFSHGICPECMKKLYPEFSE